MTRFEFDLCPLQRYTASKNTPFTHGRGFSLISTKKKKKERKPSTFTLFIFRKIGVIFYSLEIEKIEQQLNGREEDHTWKKN